MGPDALPPGLNCRERAPLGPGKSSELPSLERALTTCFLKKRYPTVSKKHSFDRLSHVAGELSQDLSSPSFLFTVDQFPDIPHAPLRAAGAMPRIKSFAPGWLNHPAPGHNLFALTPEDNTQPASVLFKKTKPGPRRTIARRGTEIFVAVGKQIRWGDLALLKENWDSQGTAGRIKRQATAGSFEVYDEEANGHSASAAGYRVRFSDFFRSGSSIAPSVSANTGPRSSSKPPSRTTFGS